MRAAILGAGPHGRAIQALSGVEWKMYDDDLSKGLSPIADGAAKHRWVVGAAWPWVRREIVEKLEAQDRLMPPMNNGIIKFPGAQLSMDQTGAGRHIHICHNAVVSHGCQLGDFVTVCPGAVLCGDVKVGAGTLIGAGAVVLHGGITIGHNAIVGAGAVVVFDVDDGETVAGNPARDIS